MIIIEVIGWLSVGLFVCLVGSIIGFYGGVRYVKWLAKEYSQDEFYKRINGMFNEEAGG